MASAYLVTAHVYDEMCHSASVARFVVCADTIAEAVSAISAYKSADDDESIESVEKVELIADVVLTADGMVFSRG